MRKPGERAPVGALRTPRLNLRAVSEVLVANGLDPADELAKIVKSGKLDVDIQVRVLSELLQYTQPKLKSVEVKGKLAVAGFQVNDDQARRIAEEFLAAQGSLDPSVLPQVIEAGE